MKETKQDAKVYQTWVCRCGQLVVAADKPEPMRWNDGHVCHFRPEKKEAA